MKPSVPVSGEGRQACRTLLPGAAALLLCGCASVLTFTSVGRDAPDSKAAISCVEGRPLTPWNEISGTLTLRGRSASFESGVLQIGVPADVAVAGGDLYVLDPLHGQLLVLELGSQLVRRRLALDGLGPRARLAVSQARLIYVANPASADVRQLDAQGQTLQRFASAPVLSDPVAIAVRDLDGSVLVGDGLSGRVVVFNPNGSVSRVLGAEPGAALQIRSVRDVAVAPDEVYVVDALARQVHYLSAAGRYRYSFGESVLLDPAAIALDDDNRVFVADAGDATLKIFRGGELLGVVGGTDDPDRVRFGRIGGMAYGAGLLYVADVQTISIRVFRVAAPCA